MTHSRRGPVGTQHIGQGRLVTSATFPVVSPCGIEWDILACAPRDPGTAWCCSRVGSALEVRTAQRLPDPKGGLGCSHGEQVHFPGSQAQHEV